MEANWAGNYTYRAKRIHRPESVDELRSIVAAAPRIRVLGSRHSFNEIADSMELVSLEALPADMVVDRDAGKVSFGAAMRYGDLASGPRRGGAGAAQPRLAATHLGRWGSGDGDTRLR